LHQSSLQSFASSQRAFSGVWVQLPLPSQMSAVQTIPSLFSQLVPAGQFGWWHAVSTPLQTSLVQGLESLGHVAPFGLIMLAGQVVLVPVQVSATSHGPAAARQTAPAFPAGC
jgi:hypothetical protein